MMNIKEELETMRPSYRRDCLPGGCNEARPCVFWACPYHLAVESADMGNARLKPSRQREPFDYDAFIERILEMPETCCLDAIDKLGQLTLQQAGDLIGCTRERIRQIEDNPKGKNMNIGAIGKMREYESYHDYLEEFIEGEQGEYSPSGEDERFSLA